MNASPAMESALILTFPAAEPAVHEQRLALDPAAHAGVPAHITIGYPFKPVEKLTDDDLGVLTAVCAATPAFDVTFAATGWFEHNVVYLAPATPEPIVDLIAAMTEAFPEFPCYGGVFETIIPHLTIGTRADLHLLEAAERVVQPHLPITQHVPSLELWSGPPPAGGEGFWGRVRSFPLAP